MRGSGMDGNSTALKLKAEYSYSPFRQSRSVELQSAPWRRVRLQKSC
jgi:hypothetical protein